MLILIYAHGESHIWLVVWKRRCRVPVDLRNWCGKTLRHCHPVPTSLWILAYVSCFCLVWSGRQRIVCAHQCLVDRLFQSTKWCDQSHLLSISRKAIGTIKPMGAVSLSGSCSIVSIANDLAAYIICIMGCSCFCINSGDVGKAKRGVMIDGIHSRRARSLPAGTFANLYNAKNHSLTITPSIGYFARFSPGMQKPVVTRLLLRVPASSAQFPSAFSSHLGHQSARQLLRLSVFLRELSFQWAKPFVTPFHLACTLGGMCRHVGKIFDPTTNVSMHKGDRGACRISEELAEEGIHNCSWARDCLDLSGFQNLLLCTEATARRETRSLVSPSTIRHSLLLLV